MGRIRVSGVHLERLLRAFEAADFGAVGPPSSLPNIAALVPEIGGMIQNLAEGDREALLRCLGEAEATLLYEECDCRADGQQITPGFRKRIFLRSLKERLRRRFAEKHTSD